MKMKTKLIRLTALLILVILFTGCAESTNIKECIVNEPYGFWGGLWHGMIAPFSFIGSVLDNTISMYAVNNNGNWYNFGFVLGAGILFGSSKSSK